MRKWSITAASKARRSARQLAGDTLLEAATAFHGVPDSPQKRFIFQMVMYVVNEQANAQDG